MKLNLSSVVNFCISFFSYSVFRLIVLLLLPSLFFVSGLQSSVELICQNVGGKAEALILIPYGEFFTHTESEGSIINNYFSVSFVSSKGEISYQEQFDINIKIDNEQIQDHSFLNLYREYYPLRFSPGLKPDDYKIILILSSSGAGQKRTYRETYTFPVQERPTGISVFTALLGDFLFVLRGYDFLQHEYDRLELWQQTSSDSTTASIITDDKTLDISLDEPGNLEPLRSIAAGGKNFRIQINQKINGVVYSSEPTFPSLNFFINQRFTPEQQLAQLRNIMNQNEFRTLRDSDEERLQKNIELYWESVDPDIYSVDNYYQQLFYNRIMYADRNFGVLGYLEGWQTDRGKVYIRYGHPDKISTDTFPMGRVPRITWHYYNLNKTFDFYDLRGYGYYELREKWMD